jgi:GTP-binding protein YchF
MGNTDPIRDIEVINVELVLSDLEIVQGRIDKIGKKAETTKDKDSLIEYNLLKKLKDSLDKSIPLRNLSYSKDEQVYLKNYNLITLMPIIYVANTDEDSAIVGDNEYSLKVKEYASKEHAGVVVMCAKLEEQLASMEEQEKILFLDSLGINNTGLDKLIFATYDILGLATFFTSGIDEVRAWTFKKGMKAPECAGIIHSDFERGFIKAEVTSFSDLESYGDEKKVKEAGKLRLEGKDYLMQDGDICYFRFNV